MRTRQLTTWLTACATGLAATVAQAQSVEGYAGHRRTGVDIMWLRYLNRPEGTQTPLLFFSRNRASVDYQRSPTISASTNAVSYNFDNGFGLVAVASFLNTGLTPKAGVQFQRRSKDLLFFGWLVADLRRNGGVDLFGMLRYTPSRGPGWKGFSQLEIFPVHQPVSRTWAATERIRLGVKRNTGSAGLMVDLLQQGRPACAATWNAGLFLRRDF